MPEKIKPPCNEEEKKMGFALWLEIIQAESLCKSGGGGFSKLKKKELRH